jgi:hypothetical protein
MVSADADAKIAHPSCPLTGANYSFQEIISVSTGREEAFTVQSCSDFVPWMNPEPGMVGHRHLTGRLYEGSLLSHDQGSPSRNFRLSALTHGPRHEAGSTWYICPALHSSASQRIVDLSLDSQTPPLRRVSIAGFS